MMNQFQNSVPTRTLHYPTLVSKDGEEMVMEVCQSAAGYYLGYMSIYHGPYSRESTYFATESEAQDVLMEWVLGFTQALESVDV